MGNSKANTPFPAYNGDGDYIFVSYSHADSPIVYPQLERLKRLGYNIWYDEGVSPGARWSDELALRIHQCTTFLVFITPKMAESVHCQDELNYVLEANRPLLAVHLAETELPPGLKLRIGARQAIFAYQLSDAEFDRKLSEALSSFGIAKEKSLQSANEAAIDLKPGDHVGNFCLLEVLGEGGMGTVFLAEQREPVARRVALKVIKLGMDTKEVLARFEAERQALAVLSHPNVATVFEGGATSTGRPYFVMEYVPGIPITQYCDDRKLDFKSRVRLFMQACSGILHAHQKGIIHRDLKSSNIVVVENAGKPLVKIIDFGIAKSMQRSLANQTLYTRIGDIVGSPGYASPEQMSGSGDDVDTRADVYSLGIVLYELLCGACPFEDQQLLHHDTQQIFHFLRTEAPPQPVSRLPQDDRLQHVAAMRSTTEDKIRKEIRGDLSSIVMRAIRSKKDERYPSVTSFSADLERWLRGIPVEASPQTPLYLISLFVKRNAASVAVGLAVLLLLIGATAVSTYSFIRASNEAQRANLLATQTQTTVDFLLKLFEGSGPDNSPDPSTTARELLDQGAKRLLEDKGLDAGVRLQLSETVADVYLRLWIADRAIALLRDAIAVTLPELGEDNVLVLRARIKLGDVLRANDELDEAKVILEDAKSKIDRVKGVDVDDKATLANNLALVLARLGETDAAEALYLEALALRREHSGERSLPVAVVLHNLGLMYTGAGKLELAEEYTRKSLALRLELFDDEHPRVATSRSVLSTILRQQGKFAEAERLIRHTLEIQERVFGSDNDLIAINSYRLARILILTGDWEGADAAFDRALSIDTAGSVDWALDAYRAAFLHESMQNFDKAMKLADAALPILTERHGFENFDVAQLMMLKARLLIRLQGDLSKAENMARTAVQTMIALYEPQSVEVALARMTLAEVLNSRGQLEIALSLAQQALENAHADDEVTKPSRSAALEGKARIYKANSDNAKFCETLKELFTLRISHFSSDHPYVQNLQPEIQKCK